MVVILGLKNGIFPFPMKEDGFLMSPEFDKLAKEQKMYMEGKKRFKEEKTRSIKKIFRQTFRITA